MDYLDYMNYIHTMAQENVLAHHGVKGQEWGKRKYQYEDGSLTPEGKKHYGVGDGDGTNKKDPPTKAKKQEVSKAKPKDKPAEEKEKTPEELQAEAAKKAARKKKIAIAAGVTAAAIVGIVLAKKYHDMKIQNGELQAEAAKGEERFNDLKSKYDLQGKDIAKLKGENKGLLTNLESNRKELESNKKEVTTLKAINEGLSKSHRQKSEQINEMNTQISTLKGKAEDLTRTKNLYKYRLSKSEAANEGLKRTNELLNSNLKVANIQAEAGNQLANVSPVHQRTYRKILEGISNGKVLFGFKGSK